MRNLHLVDDLDKFMNYPWGRVSFEYFVNNVDSYHKNLKGMMKNPKRPQFDLNDFVYVIQTWAYKVFPNVANYCAIRVGDHHTILPRILRWSASKCPQFPKLTKFFEPGPEFKLMPIKLSAKEEEAVEAACIPVSESEPTLEPVPPPPPSIADDLLPPNKSTGKKRIDGKNEDENNVSPKRHCRPRSS